MSGTHLLIAASLKTPDKSSLVFERKREREREAEISEQTTSAAVMIKIAIVMLAASFAILHAMHHNSSTTPASTKCTPEGTR